MPTAYDSGWREEKGFRVRMILESGPPSEVRRTWYKRILGKTLVEPESPSEEAPLWEQEETAA